MTAWLGNLSDMQSELCLIAAWALAGALLLALAQFLHMSGGA